MALGIRFSRETKERDAPIVRSPFLCMGMITLVCQLLGPFQNTRSLDTHESAKELLDSRLRAFRVGFHRRLQYSLFWQLGGFRLQWWYFPVVSVHIPEQQSYFDQLTLHLRVHCAFREFSEQGRHAACKGFSYIFVRQGLPLYSVGSPGPARLCRPWLFFQMQVADHHMVIGLQFCTSFNTNVQHRMQHVFISI